MSSRLPSYFCDYSLYMIFNDFRAGAWQGKMLLSPLLLGVERAVKTCVENFLPSRPPTLLVLECYRSWLIFVSYRENPCNYVKYGVLKSWYFCSKLLENHFSVVLSEEEACSNELTSGNGLTLPFWLEPYFNIGNNWKSCFGKARFLMGLR